jgi:uncharacterized protein
VNTPPRTPIVRTRWEIRPRQGGPGLRGEVRVSAGSAPETAVVVCHGFKGFKDWGFFPFLARAIARRGHAAVTFDFSRCGVGDDGVDFSALDRFSEQTHTRNVAEIERVLGALSEGLLPRAPRAVGLFGHSRGGGEAVLATERIPVDALVTWAAISSVDRWSESQVDRWRAGGSVTIPNARTGQEMPIAAGFWQDMEANRERLDILRAARAVRAPWLIVHGGADESVPVEEARTLFSVAPDGTELLVVEGAGHTFGAVHPWAGATPELAAATESTLDWLDAHLR